jgi:hypothetical protein
MRLRAIASHGRLVVLATHDVLLSDELVTTAVALRDGRLVEQIPGRDWARSLRRGAPEAS